MFESIKLKKRQKELELIKESIIKEKEELEILKSILEEKSQKINISDVYVFSYGGISYLVNINKKNNVYYEIKDIFNKQILFDFYKNNIERGQNIYMEYNDRYNGEDSYATLIPIIEKNPDFLIYANRQVPEYLLQQYLYKINDIDITNHIKSK